MARDGGAANRRPLVASAIAMVACIALVLIAGQMPTHHSTAPNASPSRASNMTADNAEGYVFGWKQRPSAATPSAAGIEASCTASWEQATAIGYRPEWHWEKSRFRAGCKEAVADKAAGRPSKIQLVTLAVGGSSN